MVFKVIDLFERISSGTMRISIPKPIEEVHTNFYEHLRYCFQYEPKCKARPLGTIVHYKIEAETGCRVILKRENNNRTWFYRILQDDFLDEDEDEEKQQERFDIIFGFLADELEVCRDRIPYKLVADRYDDLDFTDASGEEIFIDDIDTFAAVKNVPSQQVKSLVPLDILEDQIQTYLEEIIGENFHKNDWGGEMNDLMTSYVQVDGNRLRAAFLLKGRGEKGKLTIAKCGKNGDQIVRLVEAPVSLYFIQHVDAIDERVVYDLKSKVRLKRITGEHCQMCIIDGTEMAQILKAYGKI